MAALTEARKTAKTAGGYMNIPIAAGETIFVGSLVALNATGLAVSASAAADLTAVGCAVHVTPESVLVERGCWLWDNDTAAPVTQALLGKSCYILDDQTVTAAADGSSVAGKVIGLEDGHVIVETL